MARYTSNFAADLQDTNIIDLDLLTDLLTGNPFRDPAVLRDDGKAMVYSVGDDGTFAFLSDAGFTAPWVGTINGITSTTGEFGAVSTGFAIDGAAVRDAIADGDPDTLNQLLWSRNDRITGSESNDTLRGFDGSDRVDGGGGSDALIGDAGNDRLLGRSGNDFLTGGSGKDSLFGGVGIDVLSGGSGNDMIAGGGGGDSMTGGTGADTFLYSGLGQLVDDDGELDTIYDFSRTQGDKIDVSLIDADPTLDGDQAYAFLDVNSAADQTVFAGQLRVNLAEENLYVVTLTAFSEELGGVRGFEMLVFSADGPLTADDFVL